MIRAGLVAAALAALPAGAVAQAFIIGGGMAKDCFSSVRDNDQNFRQIERVCSAALQQEALTPKNRAATFVNRGIARMRDEQYGGAISDYQRAIDIDAELGAAYLNLGAALIFQGEYEAALEPLDQSIALGSSDLHAAHYNRAIAKEQAGDIPGAYADFQEAAALNPEWLLAQRQLERFTVTGTN